MIADPIEPVVFRVYRDPKTKNEFVFYAEGHCEDWNNHPEWGYIRIGKDWMFAMLLGIEIAPRRSLEIMPGPEGELVFDHVQGTMTSPKFLHGGCSTMFVGGPLFDECMMESDPYCGA